MRRWWERSSLRYWYEEIGPWWRHFSGAIRASVYALLALGLLVFTLGIIGDAFGWWTSHPFLTNVVSGLASAGFGIPVALVLIQTLTEHHRYQASRQSSRRLLELWLDQLEEYASDLLDRDEHFDDWWTQTSAEVGKWPGIDEVRATDLFSDTHAYVRHREISQLLYACRRAWAMVLAALEALHLIGVSPESARVDTALAFLEACPGVTVPAGRESGHETTFREYLADYTTFISGVLRFERALREFRRSDNVIIAFGPDSDSDARGSIRRRDCNGGGRSSGALSRARSALR